MTPGALFYSVISTACGFLLLAVAVAFLIVGMTTVRTRRPDAWVPIAASGFLFVVIHVLHLVSSLALKAGAAGLKTSVYYGVMIGVNFLGTVLSVIAWILLMIGIARIASPPPGEPSLNRAPGD